MPLYLCRWPNGDVSVVVARDSSTLQWKLLQCCGKRIQKRTGAATVLVNLWVEELGADILEEFEPDDGKEN